MPGFSVLTAVVLLQLGTDEPKDDLPSIQGTWTMVSFEVNGEAVPDGQVKMGRLVVLKDIYELTFGGRTRSFTIVLNPEPNPRTFDLTARDGPNTGRLFKGIYKVEGDTLTMCRGVTEAAERPTEFSTGAESGHSLVVWRRAKR